MAPLEVSVAQPSRSPSTGIRVWVWSFGWLLAGALLTALAYQVPARHTVTVGVDDAAYVQGWDDPANRWGVITDKTGARQPYRWSYPNSALIFPQIGLPANITLRLRAWRPPGMPYPQVRVLLNGREEIGSFVARDSWEEHTFKIASGLWKPRDLYLTLVVDPPWQDGAVQRGVQVDQAVLETAAWPVMPYPAQLVGGALATLLAAITLRGRKRLTLLAVFGAVLLFLLLYRIQVLPYPIRLFWPGLILLYLAVIAIQHADLWASDWKIPVGAHFTLRRNALVDAFAMLTVAIWGIGIWWVGRAHVVLSEPGVEKDFRVFATRSSAFFCSPGTPSGEGNCVFRADGFYQLGYPLLLRLIRPLTFDNPFLAGQLVALIAGGLLLISTYGLGRALLPSGTALLGLLLVVFNRWTTEYSLLLGTDMPFAALCGAALLALVWMRRSPWRVFIAGVICGLAFMIRHPGVLFLPLGTGMLLWPLMSRVPSSRAVSSWRLLGLLLVGFLLASLPQLVINTLATGKPFYSQQAKNIWLAVYGNTDWGRWGEAANSVSLWDVLRQDPGRFLTNWWGNLRAFMGTGGEDLSEFGRGLALRMLPFPANLLALGGVFVWLRRGSLVQRFVLIAGFVYVAGIAVGFMLPRFVLPLLPLLALPAAAVAYDAWAMKPIDLGWHITSRRLILAGCFAVLVLSFGAPQNGVHSVLDLQQPDAVAAVELIQGVLKPEEDMAEALPPEDSLAKYSAIAHHVSADTNASTLLAETGVVVPSNQYDVVGRAGKYTLYRLKRK